MPLTSCLPFRQLPTSIRREHALHFRDHLVRSCNLNISHIQGATVSTRLTPAALRTHRPDQQRLASAIVALRSTCPTTPASWQPCSWHRSCWAVPMVQVWTPAPPTGIESLQPDVLQSVLLGSVVTDPMTRVACVASMTYTAKERRRVPATCRDRASCALQRMNCSRHRTSQHLCPGELCLRPGPSRWLPLE